MDDSSNYNLELISIVNEARELIPTLENSTEVDTVNTVEFEELD